MPTNYPLHSPHSPHLETGCRFPVPLVNRHHGELLRIQCLDAVRIALLVALADRVRLQVRSKNSRGKLVPQSLRLSILIYSSSPLPKSTHREKIARHPENLVVLLLRLNHLLRGIPQIFTTRQFVSHPLHTKNGVIDIVQLLIALKYHILFDSFFVLVHWNQDVRIDKSLPDRACLVRIFALLPADQEAHKFKSSHRILVDLLINCFCRNHLSVVHIVLYEAESLQSVNDLLQ